MGTFAEAARTAEWEHVRSVARSLHDTLVASAES